VENVGATVAATALATHHWYRYTGIEKPKFTGTGAMVPPHRHFKQDLDSSFVAGIPN
jgi:hypothetical protein